MKTTDLRELSKMRLANADADGSRYPISFMDRGDDNRQIVLEVNSEEPVKLVLVFPDDKTQFLKTVEGRERITFYLRGAAELWAADPTQPGRQLWWWCSEMEQMDTATDGGTFTKVRERRERNGQLEQIMRIASYNAQRRERRILDEVRQLKQSIIAGNRADPKVNKLSEKQIAEAEQEAADKAAAEAVEKGEKKKKPEPKKEENA